MLPASAPRLRRYENLNEWPYNDGVMLWNLPYMRRTNKAFVEWTLSQRNGLWFEGEAGCQGSDFLPTVHHSLPSTELTMISVPAPSRLRPGYGPVDQGAFLQFYENEIKGKPINKASSLRVEVAR